MKKLPNATAVLILGILSVPTCFCYGIIGLVLSIVALVLAHGDQKLLNDDRDGVYRNYSTLVVGRVFASIGLVLSAVFFAMVVYIASMSTEEQEAFLENLRAKAEQQAQQDY